jgi:hypothetical protein
MQKNIQEAINELQDLKKGVHAHNTQWASLPVTEKIIDDAIADLQAKGKAIEDAEIALTQTRLAGRIAVETAHNLAEQTTTLAEGIHKNEQGKLAEYNISLNTGRKAKTIPTKAIIESIIDDYDGVGFIIKIQSLDQAEGFEIEKSKPQDSNLLVLAPPYTHLKNVTKLAYTDDEVEKGKRYFYRVRGYNRRGYGEWSEPVSRVQ